MPMSVCLCEWDWNYGLWVIATVTPTAGVIAAIIGAKSWRKQQQTAKRADAAADALIASLKLFSDLRFVSSPIRFVPAATTADEIGPDGLYLSEKEQIAREGQALWQDIERRWEVIRPTEQAFDDARHVSLVHLPPSVNMLLGEVYALRASIYGKQFGYCSLLKQGARDAALYDGALGPTVEAKISALHHKVIAELAPIAQMKK